MGWMILGSYDVELSGSVCDSRCWQELYCGISEEVLDRVLGMSQGGPRWRGVMTA